MASESIAHSAFGLMGFDSEPIRARGISVKKIYLFIYLWRNYANKLSSLVSMRILFMCGVP